MQHDTEWVKKYYTEDQLQELAGRDTSEAREPAAREWPELIREVEAAIGQDPTGPHAQSLATRWQKLVEGFTGGHPGIAKNLNKLYKDKANWPATFKKPYSDEAEAFIQKAIAAHKNM